MFARCRATICCALVACITLSALGNTALIAADAPTLAAKIGTPRGICVVLGDPEGKLALELAKASELTVLVQSPHDREVAAARRQADAAGLLGTRIYVQKGNASHINLADDLAGLPHDLYFCIRLDRDHRPTLSWSFSTPCSSAAVTASTACAPSISNSSDLPR